MSVPTVTEEFGVMAFDAAAGVYKTTFATTNIKQISISVSEEGFKLGLERISAFLAWLNANDQSFKLALEYQIQNHDLVWDDVWDAVLGNDWTEAADGFLAGHINYESVEFCRGALYVWVDTTGLHTDHKVRATVNSDMHIELCELM